MKKMIILLCITLYSMANYAQCNDATYISKYGTYYNSKVPQMVRESYIDPVVITVEGLSYFEFGKIVISAMKSLFSKQRLKEMGSNRIIFSFYFDAIKKQLAYVSFCCMENGEATKIPFSNEEMCLLEKYFKSKKYHFNAFYKTKSSNFTIATFGVRPSKLAE